jgi:hypothetical protein
MQMGQLADLTVEEGAALALLGRGMPGEPHVKVGDQLAPTPEHEGRSLWLSRLPELAVTTASARAEDP